MRPRLPPIDSDDEKGKKYELSIKNLLNNDKTDPKRPTPLATQKPPVIPRARAYLIEERERVRRRVTGFDWKDSVAWQTLTQMYGSKLNHEELVSIAELVSKHAMIKLDRDAKRRKIVLVKWFEEHWQVVRKHIDNIVLESVTDNSSPDFK